METIDKTFIKDWTELLFSGMNSSYDGIVLQLGHILSLCHSVMCSVVVVGFTMFRFVLRPLSLLLWYDGMERKNSAHNKCSSMRDGGGYKSHSQRDTHCCWLLLVDSVDRSESSPSMAQT